MKIGGVLGRVWWFTDMYKPCPEEPIRGVVRVVFWIEDGYVLATHGRVFHLRDISTHGRGNLSVS